VEGNLNSAPANTTITISRSEPLTDTATEMFENGAAVTVEGSDGSVYTATAGGNGAYSFGVLPLDSTKTYRLNIKTMDGSQYLSAYVPVISNPPIDSVNVTYDANGATLNVNTHDIPRKTGYYEWSYIETWEYHSAEESEYIYVQDSGVVSRAPAQEIFTCYESNPSSAINIYSTAKLSQDVVYENPLLTIPRGDQRLSVEYSLLVNQYAITDSAFFYLQIMKTNTDNLGSIFDPLPSSLTGGNIHCVNNPAEQVIGYVNASGFQQLRIFVTEPPGWGYTLECPEKDTLLPGEDAKDFGGGNPLYTPVMGGGSPGSNFVSNLSSCVNCLTQGGTTTKPPFWP
jgi:hypothetical protein